MHRHPRTRLSLTRFSLLAVLTLLLASLVSAFTASTAVPRTGADAAQRTITPNDLKPLACATLDLTALVTGSGAFTVGSTTLVLASGGADTIDILGSGNCVLAGGGSDICYTSLLGSNVIIDCESVGPKPSPSPSPSPGP